MLSINPYLNFKGNTEEAMRFYKKILGGEFTLVTRYGEIPGGDKMPEPDRQKINHITLTLPNGSVIMATDVLEFMDDRVTMGTNFFIIIHTENEEETDRLFNALSENGKIEVPVNKTFWGAYFGMCVDRFGVQWMINYSYKK